VSLEFEIMALQRKFYCRPGRNRPLFRFYNLYGKVHRADIMSHSYSLARDRMRSGGRRKPGNEEHRKAVCGQTVRMFLMREGRPVLCSVQNSVRVPGIPRNSDPIADHCLRDASWILPVVKNGMYNHVFFFDGVENGKGKSSNQRPSEMRMVFGV